MASTIGGPIDAAKGAPAPVPAPVLERKFEAMILQSEQEVHLIGHANGTPISTFFGDTTVKAKFVLWYWEKCGYCFGAVPQFCDLAPPKEETQVLFGAIEIVNKESVKGSGPAAIDVMKGTPTLFVLSGNNEPLATVVGKHDTIRLLTEVCWQLKSTEWLQPGGPLAYLPAVLKRDVQQMFATPPPVKQAIVHPNPCAPAQPPQPSKTAVHAAATGVAPAVSSSSGIIGVAVPKGFSAAEAQKYRQDRAMQAPGCAQGGPLMSFTTPMMFVHADGSTQQLIYNFDMSKLQDAATEELDALMDQLSRHHQFHIARRGLHTSTVPLPFLQVIRRYPRRTVSAGKAPEGASDGESVEQVIGVEAIANHLQSCTKLARSASIDGANQNNDYNKDQKHRDTSSSSHRRAHHHQRSSPAPAVPSSNVRT